MTQESTNDPAKRAAIYAHSASGEEGGENALSTQLRKCREYCSEHGYEVGTEHIYQEVGSSLSQNRPQLQALMEAARDGEFEIVVVSSYDRLSRDRSTRTAILSTLQEVDIQVESVEEPHGLIEIPR